MVKILALFVSCWLLLAGCSSSARMNQRSLQQIPAALLGNFSDDYGSSYTISKTVWQHGTKAKYHLLQYDEEGNFFIAKNDKDNPTDPGLFTRIDIVYFEGMEPWRWGYCLTAYKANTMTDALNTAAADRANPRKGCNGFPFSRMMPLAVKQKEAVPY